MPGRLHFNKACVRLFINPCQFCTHHAARVHGQVYKMRWKLYMCAERRQFHTRGDKSKVYLLHRGATHAHVFLEVQRAYETQHAEHGIRLIICTPAGRARKEQEWVERERERRRSVQTTHALTLAMCVAIKIAAAARALWSAPLCLLMVYTCSASY